ncbi:MAG: signal peptidase I [Candidatus Ranarchaeia archaeon]
MISSNSTNEIQNGNSEEGKSNKGNVIFLTLIILVFVSPIFINAGLNTALRSEFPIVVVTSESMVPTINVGDLALIAGVLPEDIQNGSIIVFQATWRGDSAPPVIHRVINITEDGDGKLWFTTKGDNSATNPFPDPEECPEDRVYGVSVFIIPFLGHITLWLQTGFNYYIVIFLFAVYIIMMFISEFRNKENEEE